MRDKGLDKGLIRYFDDAPRNYRGQEKNFFGFRKMFRDYLTKLNVAFYDTCCPAATPVGIVPVRYNDTSNVLQYYNTATDDWSTVDAGALVSDSITLDDGTVGALAVRIGADANNGLYGVSDTVLGVAVEGAQVATFTTTGMTVGTGGVGNIAATMLAGFFPTIAAQALSGAGAVNVTAYLTKYTSTAGAQALTLASGTQVGQRKKVSHVVDGGSGVLTAVFVGGTTITFTTVGEFADLIWTGTAWAVLELGNTATPGTPPVLA
jgi:hypothetical protein